MKRVLIWLVPLLFWFAPAQAQNVTVHVVPTCGAETLPTTPPAIAWLRMDQTGVLCTSGSGGGGGASNITQWATTALGVPTAYGTAPTTGNYIGVNAFVTNANTNGQKTMANSSPVVLPSDQIVNVLVTNGLATATGISTLLPANSTPVVVKASAGTLWYGHITGIAAAPVYVKFYDNASACSGTLRYQLTLPVASTAGNGAGDIPSFPTGITFATGITYCATTDITAANSGAPTVSTASLNYGFN
jgi:hypothetical protein